MNTYTKILRTECAWCKTPTDGKGPIKEEEKAFTSHGICDKCLKKHFPSTPHRPYPGAQR